MSYEFNQAQNKVFLTLAFWMNRLGILIFGFAALQAVALAAGLPTQIALMTLVPSFGPIILFNFVLGLGLIGAHVAVAGWTKRSAAEFQQVVDTKGNDLSHLMVALEHLRKTYRLITNLLVAMLLLVVVWWLVAGYIMRSTLN